MKGFVTIVLKDLLRKVEEKPDDLSKKDLDEISDEVKQVIDFISVKNFDEVLPIALVSRPIKKKEVKENIIVTDKTSKTNVVTQ